MDVKPFQVNSLVDLLANAAQSTPGHLAFQFYRFTAAQTGSQLQVSYGQLWQQARALGAQLARRLEPGERALIVCPPGLDYIIAFFACQLAGIIAVPAYPPRNSKHMERLGAILQDAKAHSVLCLSSQLRQLHNWEQKLQLACLPVDQCLLQSHAHWVPVTSEADVISYLQYTSGTTGLPKGVMASHQQILENLNLIQKLMSGGYSTGTQVVDAMCSWLPPFHDLGLIGTILLPLYMGVPAHLMAPASFVQ
ncbi:AMP-binding protein [Flexibacterium corallicola]|uniref:AMP-binding protein n=1 Tax=Flexibacterium corallicola TaxID=3037259 RepID=UPI0038621511